MRARPRSSGRARIIFLDWTRKALQLAALVVVLAVVYLVYGFMSGGAADWASLDAAARQRLMGNVQTGVAVLNISLAVLLITSVILFHDEETLGWSLVAGACFLYYGIPFLISFLAPDALTQWEAARNSLILAILQELRLAGIMIAVPGAALAVRDMVLRISDGSRRNRERLTAMEFGGAVEEEKPISPALIGAFAQCWRMPFCREFIRVRCPIFHARTRCWRQRVGCMCEENVIRTAMAEMMAETEEDEVARGPVDFAAPVDDGRRIDLTTGRPLEKTQPVQHVRTAPKIARRNVRIPHNPNISMAQKRERCRNCVIYTEHERMKYQLLAPILVIAVPALAFLKIEDLRSMLGGALSSLDSIMARLSFDPQATQVGLASLANQERIAQYAVLACLILIVTTSVLRFLEHCMFRLKI